MSATIDILGELHDAVAHDLLRRLKSGEATASDIANALRFLKDNGIEAIPAEGSPMGDLLDAFNMDNVVDLEARIGSR